MLILLPNLERNRFTVRWDSDFQKWIPNLADATGRLAPWRRRLSEFEFDLVHRAGNNYKAADALSQMLTDGSDTALIKEKLHIAVIDATSNHMNVISPQQSRYQNPAYIV